MSVGPPGEGDIVATGTVDEFGSLLFRDLEEQTKYFLSTDEGTTASPYLTLGPAEPRPDRTHPRPSVLRSDDRRRARSTNVRRPDRGTDVPCGCVAGRADRRALPDDAPGGNRAVWAFETIADGELVQLGIGGDRPSSVVLPVIPGVEVPPSSPACASLRGQPCRIPVLTPPAG